MSRGDVGRWYALCFRWAGAGGQVRAGRPSHADSDRADGADGADGAGRAGRADRADRAAPTLTEPHRHRPTPTDTDRHRPTPTDTDRHGNRARAPVTGGRLSAIVLRRRASCWLGTSACGLLEARLMRSRGLPDPCLNPARSPLKARMDPAWEPRAKPDRSAHSLARPPQHTVNHTANPEPRPGSRRRRSSPPRHRPASRGFFSGRHAPITR